MELEGATVTYREDAHRLEQRLSMVPGVRYAALRWPTSGQLEIGVVLDENDLDVRATAIELIDEFHRADVHEVGVDFDIVDAEHADCLFEHA